MAGTPVLQARDGLNVGGVSNGVMSFFSPFQLPLFNQGLEYKMDTKKQKITAKYIGLNSISLQQVKEMHALFIQYYHNADLATFIDDLAKKDGLILISEVKSKKIVGFSTLMTLRFNLDGREVKGVFSGDTIVARKYWGTNAAMYCFVKQLLKEKIKEPLTPLFWLLISKGYKTYLLLANNFPKHYPHYRGKFENLSPVVNQYCQHLYPSYFNEQKQILDFGDSYQKLRGDVAEITPEMKQAFPKIDYFEEKNPDWREGKELPCIGQVNAQMLAFFARKEINKRLKRSNVSRDLSLGSLTRRLVK